MSFTTIQVDSKILATLKKLKAHPRQSYNELLSAILRTAKKEGHYDEYLHEIQKGKMKELWDNPEDEDWDNA